MITPTEERIFIECTCGDHAVKVLNSVNLYEGEDGKQLVDQEFYLSFFDATGYRPGIINRIRVAWRFLTTGKLHEDQIVMTPDEARKLGEFILEKIIATKEGEKK